MRDTHAPSHDWPRFIVKHTELMAPPLVPEVRLHLAAESLAIWQLTEDELAERNVPPPYWAFAWAGGQALARYILDRPVLVAGRRVLDLGSGSGLTAIAACRAGAADVLAADIDPVACAAALMNAQANGVSLDVTTADRLDPSLYLTHTDGGPDVVLVGDLFYEKPLAERVLAALEAAAGLGARVLVGDPQRSYFPRDRFEQLAEYQVPVSRELEDIEIKPTAVWGLKTPS